MEQAGEANPGDTLPTAGDETSESELVARAQAGDRGAYEALLERHLPQLEAFVRGRLRKSLGAREGASDVLQSTVRDLLENREKFQHGDEAAFRHWVYATAARKIADKHAFHNAGRRDRRRESSSVDGDGEDLLGQLLAQSASPTQKVAAAELLERLEQTFRTLSEDERQVILLSKVLELSRAEMAAELGRTENGTRNLLHRALIKLAAGLDSTAP